MSVAPDVVWRSVIHYRERIRVFEPGRREDPDGESTLNICHEKAQRSMSASYPQTAMPILGSAVRPVDFKLCI